MELINHDNFNKNLCFEMNTIPVLMTYLASKKKYKINKITNETIIPKDFNFESFEQRQRLIEKKDSPFKLNGLRGKTITLKKNNIKNKFENYYVMLSYAKPEYLRKDEYGNEVFDIDLDYKTFFNINNVETIILKDTLFSVCTDNRVKEDIKNQQTTITNLMLFTSEDERKYKKKNYKIDIKSLNEIIYKNKGIDDFTNLFKIYLSVSELKDKQKPKIDLRQNNKIATLKNFCDNLINVFNAFSSYSDKITIIFDNIKERKEFFCLLIFYKEINDKKNSESISFSFKEQSGSFSFPDKDLKIRKQLYKYFIKEENEEKKDKYSIFNYYYTSPEEIQLFGKPGTEKDEKNKIIEFDDLKFRVEYSCFDKNQKSDKKNESGDDPLWDTLWE
jgi:hypothetical protein